MQLVSESPLNMKEVMNFLKVSRKTLLKLEREGLPYGRLGKQKRYFKDQLVEYINKTK